MGNVALIEYALKLLSHHGIVDVIVNVHHLGKMVKDALGDGSQHGGKIAYSEEEEILGTGGGLKKMDDQLADDTFVVVNSDTILDVDLGALLETHRAKGALATMVLRADERQDEFGQLEVDEENRVVTKIVSKQSEAVAVTTKTTEAAMCIQGNPALTKEALREITVETCELVQRICGATWRIVNDG